MARVACLLLSLCVVGCSGPAPPAEAARPAPISGAPPSVQLWQDASIFKLVGSLIGHARRRVLVEVYEIGRPDLIDVMASAHGRGADVRVITDPTVEVSRVSLDRLNSARVPSRFYPVDDTAHQIDHVKLLIAGMLGFKPFAFFQADAADREVPVVSFNQGGAAGGPPAMGGPSGPPPMTGSGGPPTQ